MNQETSFAQLERLLESVAELAALQILINMGALRPYLNKSEAFRLFGRANIERWIRERLITPRKDGDHSAAWRIDRMEIEFISRAIRLLHNL